MPLYKIKIISSLAPILYSGNPPPPQKKNVYIKKMKVQTEKRNL